MRRIAVLLLAFYLVFLGGSTYYYQVFAIRVAHHVVLTALLIIWLISKLRTTGLPKTPFNPLIYALVTLWLITSALALDPRIAFESAWFPITHTLIFFVVVDWIGRGRQRLVMETIFMLGTLVVIAALVQVYQWWAGWEPLLSAELPFPPVLPRLDQPFGVSTWLSAFAAPLIILSAGWALSVRRKDYRPALWGLAAALLIVLIFTASRGGYIALATGIAVLFVLRLWGRRSLHRLIPLIISLSILAAGIGGVVFLISRDPSRVAGDTLRADLWSSAVTMTLRDPFTGVGVGMFGRGHRLYRDATFVDDRLGTAHNLYLNLTAETGVIGIYLLGVMVIVGAGAWFRQWRNAKKDARKLRLEAALAALIGFSVQSLFDTFTLTALVILPLILIAYCITPSRLVSDSVPRGAKLPAALFTALIAIFGVGLLISDRAHTYFNSSVATNSLEDAQTALVLDPSMRLYQLQVDYLIGMNADDLPTRIAAFERAVALEPTWDTGWINLAVLQNRAGETESAFASIERAANIRYWNGAWFGWALLTEQTSDVTIDEIRDAYILSITYPPTNDEWWNATDARRSAFSTYTDNNLIVLSVGDEYVQRAYARFATEPDAAWRDLAIAEQFGTYYENLALARVDLARTPEVRRAAQISAVSGRIIDQNFEAVLFQGRRAQFVTLPGLTGAPPTETDLRVWYELAESLAAENDDLTALQVYRLMLERFPHIDQAQLDRIDAAINTLETN